MIDSPCVWGEKGGGGVRPRERTPTWPRSDERPNASTASSDDGANSLRPPIRPPVRSMKYRQPLSASRGNSTASRGERIDRFTGPSSRTHKIRLNGCNRWSDIDLGNRPPLFTARERGAGRTQFLASLIYGSAVIYAWQERSGKVRRLRVYLFLWE